MNNTATMNNTPLIYNIPTDQWVHDFVVSGPLPSNITATPTPTLTTIAASSQYPTSPNNFTSPPTPTSSASSKTSGAIGVIGGAVGAAVGTIFLSAIAFFCYRRRRMETDIQHSFADADDDSELYRNRREYSEWIDSAHTVNYDEGYTDESRSQTSTRNGAEAGSHPFLKRAKQSYSLPSRLRRLSDDLRSESTFVTTATPKFLTATGPAITPRSQHSTFSTISTPSTMHHSIKSGVPYSVLSSPRNILNTGGFSTRSISSNPFPQVNAVGGGRHGLHFSSSNQSFNSAGFSYHNSPQYIPAGYDGYAVWGYSDQDDVRSPHQTRPRYNTSPAAWMSMMNATHPADDTPQKRHYHPGNI